MANQTYQLVVTYNAFGQFAQNVFHYRVDDDSFANRLLAAKGLVEGFIAAGRPTTLMDMFPNEVERTWDRSYETFARLVQERRV